MYLAALFFLICTGQIQAGAGRQFDFSVSKLYIGSGSKKGGMAGPGECFQGVSIWNISSI
jgi:hypothetical protein